MVLDQLSPTCCPWKTSWSNWTHLVWLDQLSPTCCPWKTSWSSWTHHHMAGSAVSYLLPLEDQLVLLDTPTPDCISCFLPAGLDGQTYYWLHQLFFTCCPGKTSWSCWTHLHLTASAVFYLLV